MSRSRLLCLSDAPGGSSPSLTSDVKPAHHMGLYLTASRIPEMAALTRAQRRFVKRQCFFWLFHRIPYRVGSGLLSAACVLLGCYLMQTFHWGMWKGAAATGASLSVLGHLYDMMCIGHWRPEVGRFIQLHEAEIKAAA